MADSEERSVAGVTIECAVGDIASQGGFEIAVGTVVERASDLSSVRRIRFVLYDPEIRNVFRRALDSALEGRP